MKEISKAEFIRRITNGKSYFLGISPAMDESEINACEMNLRTMHYSKRTAKANGYHITFSNDSHLYLNDNKSTFIKCYEWKDFLVVEQKFVNKYYGFDDEITYKYLYYYTEKENANA